MSGILEWDYLMHAFLSGLMAAALFVHAIGGCALHCARAGEACVHPTSCAATIAVADCCEHSQVPVNGELPQGPGHQQRDCHGYCIYLPTQKAQLDLSHDLTLVDVAATPLGITDAQLWASCATGFTCEPRIFEPPLGLHLLHQHLLI
jgi:hypothetical protein